MSEHTFDIGEFRVAYRLCKHHPNDGPHYDDFIEIRSVSMWIDGWEAYVDVTSQMLSVDEFKSALTMKCEENYGPEPNEH